MMMTAGRWCVVGRSVEARERERVARARRVAANTARMCPPDHRHAAATTCYSHHGCRCDSCRAVRQERRRRSDWEANRIAGRDVWVSAVGSRRRIEALAWMGWSAAAVAARMGTHYRPVLRVRAGEHLRVRTSTHRRIEAVFRELALVEAPGRSGEITRGYARLHGYVPPLAWTNIDDPAEVPKGVVS